MKWLDRCVEASTRGVAKRVSRRSFVTTLAGLMFGGATLPLLPVARGAAASREAGPEESALKGEVGDPSSCSYWRHCAIDGFLCNCCGGSQTHCPPGTEIAKLTWIGTCTNPGDGKDYIVSTTIAAARAAAATVSAIATRARSRCTCRRRTTTPILVPGHEEHHLSLHDCGSCRSRRRESMTRSGGNP
jgi:methylamine dehydrogenase light chain